MDVWLIRHGESTANAGARGETPEGTPLTERGLRQAALIAEQFETRPARVIVSPFLRTAQTAAPLLQKFGLSSETWPVQEWIFLEPSRYQGTTWAERRPVVQTYMAEATAESKDGPGAESFVELSKRVATLGRRLEESPVTDSPTLIFSHGRFIQAVLWALLCNGANWEYTTCVDGVWTHAGGPYLVPFTKQLQSFWAFEKSFEMRNGTMIHLRRGLCGWYLHDRRDINEEFPQAPP